MVLCGILPRRGNTYTPQCVAHNKTRRVVFKFFHGDTVTLIPKPHKHSRKKGDYRPISLMNINAKILNKRLTNQIQEDIKKIHFEWTINFITEMQDWFNIWKSINVIHHINKLNIDLYLSPFTKLKGKTIKDLNINSITQDLIEEKKEISLQYMGTWVHFSCWTPVA